MIAQIANIFKTILTNIDNGEENPKGLNFVSHIAGIVVVGEKVQPTDVTGAFAVSKFPISLDIDYEKCFNTSCYQELVPNSKSKGVLYFEDFGTRAVVSTKSNEHNYISKLRLVCWINNKLIQGTNCKSINHFLITHIRKHIEKNNFNSGDFVKIKAKATGILENDYKIFDRYTYPKESVKFLMHPYEAFAIDFEVNYAINTHCTPEVELNPASC